MSNTQNFNNYIVQLIEELRESAENLPDPNEITEFDEESLPEELKMFADVERYLHGKAKKISYITGINSEKFPEARKLTDAQLSVLLDEMQRTLASFGFFCDFPAGLPADIKYKLLKEKWDDKVVYAGGSGASYFEFCEYEPTECPYPEKFCRCKGFDLDDDFDPKDLKDPGDFSDPPY